MRGDKVVEMATGLARWQRSVDLDEAEITPGSELVLKVVVCLAQDPALERVTWISLLDETADKVTFRIARALACRCRSTAAVANDLRLSPCRPCVCCSAFRVYLSLFCFLCFIFSSPVLLLLLHPEEPRDCLRLLYAQHNLLVDTEDKIWVGGNLKESDRDISCNDEVNGGTSQSDHQSRLCR